MNKAALEPISYALFASDFSQFAARLGASFARHGFAVIDRQPLQDSLVTAMLADAKAFFALPATAKLRYRIAGAAGQRGFTPFAVETAKGAAHPDLKEFWHIGPQTGESRGPMLDNVWPSEFPDFRAHGQALYAAFAALGRDVLSGVGAYLALEPGFLEAAVLEGNSVLRLLHYPPSDFGGAAVRAGPHEDINAITLLLGAEEAGLEILSRDGGWRPINPPPGAVVVNVGDMLARLTNDMLPSTTHRVVNPEPGRRQVARYSMPFFLHFRPDFMIETAPQCVSRDRPNRYPTPITAADFLIERLREIRLA